MFESAAEEEDDDFFDPSPVKPVKTKATTKAKAMPKTTAAAAPSRGKTRVKAMPKAKGGNDKPVGLKATARAAKPEAGKRAIKSKVTDRPILALKQPHTIQDPMP